MGFTRSVPVGQTEFKNRPRRDDDGNRISKEEWRELGRRKAERRKRAKADGSESVRSQGFNPDAGYFCATFLLARGVHAKYVQELLGHATIPITFDTYSHILPGMGGAASGPMDETLG